MDYKSSKLDLRVADTAAAQAAVASAPSEVPCSVGPAAEDRLPEQPLCAPGRALCMLIHLPCLQPGILFAGQVLQVRQSELKFSFHFHIDFHFRAHCSSSALRT